MSDKKLEKLFKKALGKAKKASSYGSSKPKPKPKAWQQIGGDVNPKEHGCVLARTDDSGVEVVSIDPNEEGRGWYRTTNYFFNSDLTWDGQAKAPRIASSIGVDRREWESMSNTQRAEAAQGYHGAGWGGDNSLETKWYDALPTDSDEIKWWE